ncbi:YdaS family helix-turn-helix protein [Pseudomonas sp. D(2018)]|uniref:transcriptional regulator n=1 Tax=Pseudomonas sp. D(2018) TaxID=2502238 RepID=UPI0010F65530|nr:YdaS family helix-turn-helix protein [Pseudomonas sp. D(2018)]
MNISDQKREAFAKAIQEAGGQTAFAQLVSTPERPISQQLVSYWLKKGELPAEFVLRVEMLCGVPREELRPDVFCMPEGLQSPHAA